MLDGILDKLGVGLDAEKLHHAILVEFNRARADVEDRRDFLHRFAFRQQLQDFPFPCAQLRKPASPGSGFNAWASIPLAISGDT